MYFPDLLAKKVRPELNHIYTEPPHQTLTGLDCGWYCREHAFHLYALAYILQKPAEICLGDFILRRPNHDTYFSVGDKSDHAWCRIGGCPLVDASMTVKHIHPDIPDIELIYGSRPDLAEPFEVAHQIDIPDETFMHLAKSENPLIAYNEKVRLRPAPSHVLSDPFDFLHKPPAGSRTFPEIFGSDVFYAITYHCFRLITEDIRPLFPYRTPKSAVSQMMKYNPDAKNAVEHLLSQNNEIYSV